MREIVLYRTESGHCPVEEKVMSDIERYIEERKARDPEFADGYESGYADFKIGVLIRQAREEAGLTQGEL